MMDHISRSWGKDAFAPQCGCTLLPCGMVEAEQGTHLGCDQHSWDAGKTIRSNHDIAHCPAIEWTDLDDGIHQRGTLTIVDESRGTAIVTVKGYVRNKPGMVTIEDPQAITLRSFGHDD